jgi:hypothetical protein
MGLVTHGGRAVEVPIPVCPACQEEVRQRRQHAGSQGLSLGALAGLVLLVLVALGGGRWNGTVLGVLALGALAAGGLAGFLLGTALAGRPPAQLRRYSPRRGTLSLRFRDPEYAGLVLEAMRDQGRRGQG